MELLVSCSMFAILAAIAVPQYSGVARQMRTGAASSQLLADLSFARQMAMRTGVPHYIQVGPGSGVDYAIQREAAPPAVAPGTDPVVRRAQLGSRLPGVSFDLAGASADPYGGAATTPTPTGAVVFDARGLPSSAATFFIASSDGATSHAVSVTGAGRVRLWSRSNGAWR